MSLVNLSISSVASSVVCLFVPKLFSLFQSTPSKLIYYPFYWARVIYDYSGALRDMRAPFFSFFNLLDWYKCVDTFPSFSI